MVRAIKWLISLPILVLLGSFAGSNRDPLTLGLWPTDYSLTMPASLAVLGAAAIAFFAGGIFVWIGHFGDRRALHRAEETVRLLEDRLQAAKARPATTDVVVAAPPHG